jgi:multicomponent K+:H+ antiporter subunit E
MIAPRRTGDDGTAPPSGRVPLAHRLLPQPLVSLVLLLVWLLAANRVSVGLLLLGLGFAVGIPLATHPFWPEAPRRVRPGPLVGLVGVVAWDIVVANLRVARLILGPGDRLAPAFFEVPVALRDPVAVALLASIVSLTPGTVSTAIGDGGRTLQVHGLDVRDVPAAVARIRDRYERRLQAAFAEAAGEAGA